MKALGKFLTRGPAQAVLTVVGLSGLATIIAPFAYWLAGTPLALLGLRQGWQRSLQIMLAATMLVVVILLLSGVTPYAITQFLLGIWVSVLVVAIVLRESESQGVMVAAGAGMAAAFVFFMHYTQPDLTAYYQGLFNEVWDKHIVPGLTQQRSPEDITQLKAVADKMVPLLNGIRASLISFAIISTVLLARAWQSQLFNPGGFWQEFLNLRIPEWLLMAIMVAAVIVFSQGTVNDSVARDCLMVLVMAYAFQGAATVHAAAANKAAVKPWVIAMYLSLLFVTLYAVIILCCIGIADSVLRRGNSRRSH